MAASIHNVSATEHTPLKEASILQTWSGDYPVAQLSRLPVEHVQSAVGFVRDKATFAAVWEAFKPGENLPEVDFDKNIIVFNRNVDFYNRTNIIKVTLKDGVAEVLAMETRSARPIDDRAAMALAVIPRDGVKFLRVGAELVAVRQK
ncbi:hypothetical protein SAMN05660420_02066 [Desulfuromusa kysingii]|uniref:Uncharacterized protein n=2 Tax=Desulfuromusa kysingii TaxID=37625 RepID=A0A1H4B7G2_9BACT|nr:hypothetical protein SAMN05660420_02066 [Desulfuromusa kysingii]